MTDTLQFCLILLPSYRQNRLTSDTYDNTIFRRIDVAKVYKSLLKKGKNVQVLSKKWSNTDEFMMENYFAGKSSSLAANSTALAAPATESVVVETAK